MKRLGAVAILVTLFLLVAVAPVALALGSDWSDSFNGSAQQTWVPVNNGINSAAVVQNNRYELHTEGTSSVAGALASYVNISGASYTVQARVQQMVSGDTFLAYLLARTAPATMSAYALGASSDGTHFWFGKLTGGVYSDLPPTYSEAVTFDATDFQLKLTAFGSTLLGKVWSTSGAEPDHWQIKATDSSYATGVGGIMIGTYPTLSWNIVQAAFDDVSFTTPSQVWVDDDWATKLPGDVVNGHTFGYDAFAAVQNGVSAVTAGGTVNVAAGSYAGNITINKSLTLLGDPGDAAAGPGVNAPVIDGGSTPGSAFFITNGVTNVTISGFEMRNFTSNDTGVGNGIEAWQASTSNITVQDNYFHHLGYNGILVGNDDALGDHTNWLVKNNIVANVEYIGFELTNTSNSSIEGNTIHLNSPDIGAIFSSARRSETGLSIKNNLIDGTPSGAFPVIYIYAYDVDVASPHLDGVLIEGNTINTTGTPFQIYVRDIDYAGIPGDGGKVTGVVVRNNTLSTLKNLTAATVDAQHNYWGTVAFSEIVPKISGAVHWSPWCNSDFSNCTYAWPVHNVTRSTDHQTIQAAVDAASSGDIIQVDAGTYLEDVVIGKALTLTGAGVDQSTIKGLKSGANSATVRVSTGAGVTIQGFTITRDGNNTTDWAANVKMAGVAIQGAAGNAIIRNNKLTGNRTAIDINNSSGNQILNNIIDFNRTGIVLRNSCPNNIIEQNAITNNWTMGVLWLVMATSDATGTRFLNNQIEGNWYSQIENENPTGGIKDFSGNWLGAAALVTRNTNSTEPGYTGQIPVEYGGTAVNPGSAPSASGDGLALMDFTPWLASGTDTNVETSPGRGTFGFQGSFATLWVDDDSAQTGSAGRIQEGINLVSGSTVNVAAGTYVEAGQTIINKDVTIVGADKASTIIKPGSDTGSSGDSRGWWLVNAGKTLNLSKVTLDGSGRNVYQGIRILGQGTINDCALTNIKYPGYMGVGIAAMGGPAITVSNSTFSQMGRIGVIFFGSGITSGAFSGNIYTGKGVGDWLDYAVEVGGGAHAAISNNTISGNRGVATSDGSTSAGILVTTYFGAGSQATITGNTLTGNTDGIQIGYDGADSSVVVAHNNIITGNTGNGIDSTGPVVDATSNWWGSACGPGPVGPGSGDKVSTNVTFGPWFTAPGGPGTATVGASGELVIPLGASQATAQAILNCAGSGSTVVFEGGAFIGGLTVSNPGITINLNGSTVGRGSPAFTIAADDVTISGPGALNGSGWTGVSSAIVVNAGVQRLYIHDMQIMNWPADGIHFDGAITDLKLIDNYIHNNSGHGVAFSTTPGGVAQLYGNSFRNNGGAGVSALTPSSVTATYNEWGSYDGPNTGGDGTAGSVTSTPWTFGKVFADAVPPSPVYIREGLTVDVDIKVDGHELYGAQLSATFDPTYLEVVSLTDAGAGYLQGSQGCTKSFNNTLGTVTYYCTRSGLDGTLSNLGIKLLTITFRAKSISGSPVNTPINVTAASVVLSSYNSGLGSINIHLDSVAGDSVTILDTTTVSGQVDLQGRGDESGASVNPAAGVSFGYDAPAYTTGLWGSFSFSGMASDTYTVVASRLLYLAATKTVAVSGDTLALPTVVLLGGNANNDAIVNIQDLSCIGGDFGNTPPSPTACGVAPNSSDVNGDGTVNILDLVLAGGNFGKTESPW